MYFHGVGEYIPKSLISHWHSYSYNGNVYFCLIKHCLYLHIELRHCRAKRKALKARSGRLGEHTNTER